MTVIIIPTVWPAIVPAFFEDPDPMRTLLLQMVVLCLSPSLVLAADDWPQFRGPGGQGHAEATGLPVEWSETENVAWKVPVPGRGWSSPVIRDGQLWITTALETMATEAERDAKLAGDPAAKSRALASRFELRAIGVDVQSGSILHDIPLLYNDDPDPIHPLNSYASPTPVLDEGRLYCHFGTYGTYCLDTRSGEILWTQRLPLAHGVGPGSSPVIHDGLLILTCDGMDQQYVTALDKATGETVWRTDRPPIRVEDGDHRKAYSTPLVIQADGGTQVVVPGAQWVVAYEPLTGREIWRADYDQGFSNVPRPVFGHGMAYICTGFNVPELWAIRVDGQGDVTRDRVAWKSKRQLPQKPSPLLIGDEIYVIGDRGIATCLDAKTGEQVWQERIGGNFSASPLFADGRIYLCSHEGKATVIRPGRQFEQLAENELDGQLMASPAIAGRAIYLRSDTHLYRIENLP